MSLRLPSFKSPLPASKAYVLESDQGQTLTIIGSGSIVRYLATGEETGDAFAVVQSRGGADEVVPAHMHKKTHDVFLCTQGSVKLYVGDQVRILHAGDFASVPPNVPHAYQILAPETEFLGVIAPGSWIKFFDFIGEEYDASPLYPATDIRDFPVPLFIEGIKAGNDVIPLRDYDYSAAKADALDPENSLPGQAVPYYLRASSGPSWIVGNQSCSPICTTAESNGLFSLLLIAGIGASFPNYKADAAPFATIATRCESSFLARVVEGKVAFKLDGEDEEILSSKESVFVPAGTSFTYKIQSAYARFYTFSGKGRGLEAEFFQKGRKVQGGDRHEVVGEGKEAQSALA